MSFRGTWLLSFAVAVGGSPTDRALVMSADCDANGVDDALDVAPDAVVLRTGPIVPVLAVATDAEARDFDADGDLDLAFVQPWQAEVNINHVSLLWNQGGASFAPRADHGVGAEPWALTSGDLDADGRLDLVSGNRAGGSLTVLLGDGRGAFRRAADVDAEASRLVETADLDGDGDQDLVTGGLSLHFNRGDGTFEPYTEAAVSGDATIAVAPADCDRDGDLDLAVAWWTFAGGGPPVAGGIVFLWNQGAGAFVQGRGDHVEDVRRGLAARDMDQDGDVDLAALYYGFAGTDGTFSVLTNDGRGAFTETKHGSGAPLTFAVRDLDGDGSPEVAVSMYGPLVIYERDPAGDFRRVGEPFRFHDWQYPDIVAAGDFDGTSGLDLVVSTYSRDLNFLLGDGYSRRDCDADLVPDDCEGPVTDCDGNGLPDACDVLIGGRKDCDGNLVPDECDLKTHDCNASGRPDACDIAAGTSLDFVANGIPDECDVDCNRNGRPDFEDLVLQSSLDCNQNRIPDECDVAPGLGFGPALEVDAAGPAAALLPADLDGDQDPDIAVAFSDAVAFYRNLGGIRFELHDRQEVGSGPVTLAVADLNGDGRLDVVSANHLRADVPADNVTVLFQRGDGTFLPGKNYRAGRGPPGLALGDFDRDGDADVAVINEQTLRVMLLINQGDGTLTSSVETALPRSPRSLAAGDFDQDGDADLVVVLAGHDPETRSGKTAFIWSGGSGVLASTEMVLPADSGVPAGIEASDLDGDGRLDLALTMFQTNTSSAALVLRNAGGGSFEALRGPAFDMPVHMVESSDLDLDGDQDLACFWLRGSRAAAVILLNHGQASFAAPRRPVLDEPLSWAALADFAGDARPDLVYCSQSRSPRVLIALNIDLPSSPDCDLNLRPDACDIRQGTLPDCDANGIADACDPGAPDCNQNGVPDSCDLRAWRSADCDRNGVLDECDVRDARADCNGNGVPDACDLEPGVALAASRTLDAGSPVEHLSAQDVDGDGDVDVVAFTTELREAVVFLSLAVDGFSAARRSPLEPSHGQPVLGDFDGDQRLDIAVTPEAGGIAVFWGAGGGTFSSRAPAAPAETAFGSLAAADFDGDGRADLLGFTHQSFSILQVGAGGAFESRSHASAASCFDDSAAAGDLDGDGDADFVHAESFGDACASGLHVGENLGGEWTQTVVPAFLGSVLPIKLADMDLDGQVDVLLPGVLFRQDAPGAFSPGPVRVGIAFDVLDVDSDAAPDIVAAAGDILEVSLNDGAGRLGQPFRLRGPHGAALIAAAELGGSMAIDIIAASSHSGEVSILLNNTRPPFSADLDGDREPDECAGRAPFHRGDSNQDGRTDLTDAIFLLEVLFVGRAAPTCREASDADNSGRVDITDPILVLRHLFASGPPPEQPGPAPSPCGADPDPPGSAGDLGCAAYRGC